MGTLPGGGVGGLGGMTGDILRGFSMLHFTHWQAWLAVQALPGGVGSGSHYQKGNEGYPTDPFSIAIEYAVHDE